MIAGVGAHWVYRDHPHGTWNIHRRSRVYFEEIAKALVRRHLDETHRVQLIDMVQRDTLWAPSQTCPAPTLSTIIDTIPWAARVLEIWKEITCARWIPCQEKVLLTQKSRPRIPWITGTSDGILTDTTRTHRSRMTIGCRADTIR